MKAGLPPVLVPGLDLCVGQVELGGQLHPVLHTQVLLALEALLQCLQLVVSEGRPGFPRFLATGARLRVSSHWAGLLVRV